VVSAHQRPGDVKAFVAVEVTLLIYVYLFIYRQNKSVLCTMLFTGIDILLLPFNGRNKQTRWSDATQTPSTGNPSSVIEAEKTKTDNS
jgi:hypothetical protein